MRFWITQNTTSYVITRKSRKEAEQFAASLYGEWTIINYICGKVGYNGN
jgi:hypothetical protein